MKRKTKCRHLDTQLLLSFAAIGFIPIIVYIILSTTILFNSLSNFEKQNLAKESRAANFMIENKLTEVVLISKDYGIWDDMYYKVSASETDREWFKANVTDWVPSNFQVDLISILDKSGNFVCQYGVNDRIREELAQNKAVKDAINGAYDSLKGNFPSTYAFMDGSLYSLGISPIMRANYSGHSAGAVVFGKKVTKDVLNQINSNLSIETVITDGSMFIGEEKYFDIVKYYTKHLSEDCIISSKPLKDADGAVIGNMYFIRTTDNLKMIRNVLLGTSIFTALISFPIIIIIFLFLRSMFIKPINSLRKQLNNMNKTNTFSYISAGGSYEIEKLVAAYNTLVETVKANQREKMRLQRLSITDGLSGLYNQRYFYEYFENLLATEPEKVSLIFFDADNFKSINDEFGHRSGDIVIEEIASLMRVAFTGEAELFRYGGEEFAVVMPGADEQDAFKQAENFRNMVLCSREIQKYKMDKPVTISAGIAVWPKDAFDVKKLVEKADTALYYSKARGRNKTYIYTPELENFKAESADESDRDPVD